MDQNLLPSPHRIVITGASGYIGARLIEIAKARALDLVCLGSAAADANVCTRAWRIGQPVPEDLLQDADALIHLAHSWENDEKFGSTAENANISAAASLFTAAKNARVRNFVFASSVVAQKDSLNTYGRIKFLIEQNLKGLAGASPRVMFARIGFVYGGPEKGHYGLLCRLVRMTPVLPMIGGAMPIKPVYLDEVAEHLLKLALDPPPGEGKDATAYHVAPVEAINFGTWLKLLRKVKTGGHLTLVPVPVRLIRIYAAVSPYLPFFPKISRERVLGLQNTVFEDSSSDAQDLGLAISNPAKRLGCEYRV